ncbi:MAG: ABC transporter permease [Breznakia sp.]
MKSVIFIIRENISNAYKIFSIAKYELLAEMRESRLGVFWNFANPIIQIATYALIFVALRNGRPVRGVSFLPWLVVGVTVWFFINPCITKGASCIYDKRNIVLKMKFPVSILPLVTVMKELFNHVLMLMIVVVILVIRGHVPNMYWLQTFYYMFCAICFSTSLAMVTSVLNMFTRDVKKLIKACMRMLMYLTPILWTLDTVVSFFPKLEYVMKANPIYYIIEGYRGSLFFQDAFFNHPAQTLFFWGIVLSLFVVGCILMYRFKHKFSDLF